MKQKIKTQQSLTFYSDRGEPLLTQLTLVVLDEYEDQQPVCELEVSVDYTTYQRIYQESLFNLLADQLLVGLQDSLEERVVEISLKLKPNLCRSLIHSAVQLEDIVSDLTQQSLTSDKSFLLSTEAWLATEFKQVLLLPPELQGTGELKSGYQTLWAKPDRLRQQLRVSPSSISVTATQYLQNNGVEYETPEENVLRLKYQGQNGEWICLIKLDEANQHCAVYSVLPDLIPEVGRKACAVMLSYINYDLSIGNFEIDLEDGELRYRTAIDVNGSHLTPTLFENLLATNISMMDRFLPELQQFQTL